MSLHGVAKTLGAGPEDVLQNDYEGSNQIDRHGRNQRNEYTVTELTPRWT